jgi:hypothetical protein
MAGNPRIRRLTLVPLEGSRDELRRYRLARMDELALATPPDPSVVGRDRPNAAAPKTPAASTPADERARRRA